MDCIVHEVAKSRTRLSDFHFHFQVFKYMIPKKLLKYSDDQCHSFNISFNISYSIFHSIFHIHSPTYSTEVFSNVYY